MNTLDRELRRTLDKTVREARRAAEAGARKVLEQLAVQRHEAHGGMDSEARQLRNRLRAHARQLGDKRDPTRGTQAIHRLLRECAYEHWHRMLFARFLAESDLLIEPESGVPISLEECRELAREKGVDWLALASDYAERMLPQIFRTDSPVLALSLPPETRSHLEELLKDLPRDVFTAEDSLGWVYQFWQADQKDAVNRSEQKIGADQLPAVTQLFTEDYMVLFLLHNTLGAWWAGKVLADKPELAASAGTEDELRAACSVGGVEWTYLRFVRDKAEDESEGAWRPAAGAFEGWPKATKEITVLDPCMGSGHFLVFALPILAAFRVAEEELDETQAVEAVLRHNLFGLEIDPRCTQIAAFNLAFAAWRRIGFRPLPTLNLACSGLSIGVTKREWSRLAEKVVEAADPKAKRDLFGSDTSLLTHGLHERVKAGVDSLYGLFSQAPSLGSLLNPRLATGDIFSEGFDKLHPLVASILTISDSEDIREMAVAAQGMAKAAELLSQQYTLIVTNVPFLGATRQGEIIKNFSTQNFEDFASDLATCMIKRCIDGSIEHGTVATVSSQSWLFMKPFIRMRKLLLNQQTWNLIVKLGESAFSSSQAAGAFVALTIISDWKQDEEHAFFSIDASNSKDIVEKERTLCQGHVDLEKQKCQLDNPDYRIALGRMPSFELLSHYADAYKGVATGDIERFIALFWELDDPPKSGFEYLQGPPKGTQPFGGKSQVIKWQSGKGDLHNYVREKLGNNIGAWIRGEKAWSRRGVAIGQVRSLPATLYSGEKFDENTAVIVPKSQKDLFPLWAFCSSEEYSKCVRSIDQSLKVPSLTLLKVPFDSDRWRREYSSTWPNGLPPSTWADPTQWLFQGDPRCSVSPLLVSVARLVGYHWPRQTGSSFMDGPALGPDRLESHADEDGIVCLSALKGVGSAEQRLNDLLADSFGVDWSATKLTTLLSTARFDGRSMDDWLRNGFFQQHCSLFHQRPFIWHIWDGRHDGFHALVNYHRLSGPNGEGRRTFDKLIYSYLGDWIDRQRAEQVASSEGADARLAHAEHLRQELIKIREGEPPYDIFVRWKPLHRQAIGWEPDLNDGVRVNIRPFMTARPLGAKAKHACILRTPPKIKWQKDRGTEPARDKDDYPWFWEWDETSEDFAGGAEFDGKRWNDLHYSNTLKHAARERKQT